VAIDAAPVPRTGALLPFGGPQAQPRGHPPVKVGLVAPRYAVIDVETTGLEPGIDRIVECAIVELDGAGRVLDDWVSLVAIPGSEEPGASAIHGISRRMLSGAPTFPELIPELVRRLAGRILVGHVLAFDAGHLGAEFARAGMPLPDLVADGVCTRDLARDHLPPGPRSLEACCAAIGVAHHGAHSALGDARATATLLRWFLIARRPPRALRSTPPFGAPEWPGSDAAPAGPCGVCGLRLSPDR